MFQSGAINTLLGKHRSTFVAMGVVEDELCQRFVGMNEAIHALVLSVLSGQSLLLIGPPGTGKSNLIRAFCGLVGIDVTAGRDGVQEFSDYFEYLLTPFTEPNELFGYYDVAKLMGPSHEMERNDNGMMHKAKVVYLDEVFNASSAILNSLLAFLNERVFHDRGEIKQANTQVLFAATNRPPETPELRAVYDRFILRYWVENVDSKPEHLYELLNAGWQETYGRNGGTNKVKPSKTGRKVAAGSLNQLLDDCEAYQKSVKELVALPKSDLNSLALQPDTTFFKHLSTLVSFVRSYELSEMSNRRIVRMAHIMLTHYLYDTARNPGIKRPFGLDELDLVRLYFLDQSYEDPAVRKLDEMVLAMRRELRAV